MTACNPNKEEDEGYLAARAGQGAAANPYPRGTIRHREWQYGWQIRRQEIQTQDDEGYRAGAEGMELSANPHPRGTIRYEEWRLGWKVRREEDQRAARLGVRG